MTIITGTTIDGVSPAIGDRILIKDAPASTGTGSAGSTQPGNGIYTVTSNVTNLALSRATDMSGTNGPAGAFTFVEAGTVNGNAGFTVATPTTNAGFTYGTNNIKWTQFSGAGEITAGNGLGKSGNTLSIDTSITVDKTTAQALSNKDLTSGTNTFPTFNQNTTGSAANWTTARNLAGNSVDGSANVAFANKFIVQGTTDAGLSGAQFLGALGTGIVKNTTTTGVLSIAVGSDFPTLNQNTSGTAAGLSATLVPSSGGTGVANNNASTITISGNFATTLTLTNTTSVTLPTSGTLVSSVTTGNGVSATNTAGALSFTLGAITPTSVNGLTISTSSGTLTIPNGDTLTGPTSSGTAATLANAETLTQ